MIKNREQTYYLFGAILLVTVLYWGFDTNPSSQKTLEKSRAILSQGFDIDALESEAKLNLKKEEIDYVETLQSQVTHAGPDSVRSRLMKELSGFWFTLGQPIISGMYARQIAEMENTGESWSIAGNTFAAAFNKPGLEEKDKLTARDLAIEAFENAISLEPSVIEHRVNQALCYIETPDAAQPMKGIQMLASLAANYPESALPPYHLARLAVRTGQMEKAEERIEQALKIDSTNSKIACLAIDIYRAVNKSDEVGKLSGRCAETK